MREERVDKTKIEKTDETKSEFFEKISESWQRGTGERTDI